MLMSVSFVGCFLLQIASLRETIRSLQERLEKMEDDYKTASQAAAQSAQQLGV